jgi:DNA invertase Pin-like site-specific DNA recombinase
MKAALYARVSTTDKGQDPDTQLLQLRDWAARMGHTVAREYVDLASAVDLRQRSQWRLLLQDALNGSYDLVAVVKIDRAWRSVHQMHLDLDYLARHGKAFMAITQDIHTQGAIGKLTLNILAGVAEFERELISERTKEGLARAVSQGKRLGRRVVVGDVDVNLVTTMRAEGKSWADIHQAHPRTVKTPQGGYKRPSTGTIRRAMACQNGNAEIPASASLAG